MTLHSLAKQLSDYSEKLDQGSLTTNEILSLTTLSREFYERMIVLSHKTVEEAVSTNKEAKARPESTPESTPESESKTNQRSEESLPPSSEATHAETLVGKSLKSESENGGSEKISPDKPMPPPRVNAEIEETNAAEPANQYNTPPKAAPRQIELIDSIEEIKTMEKSLNESFANDTPSLAQKLHLKPIPNLRSALTINQKFQFINHLFANDSEAFETSVARIDACTTFLEADEYIQNKLKDYFEWEMNSQAAKAMMDLVERRFL